MEKYLYFIVPIVCFAVCHLISSMYKCYIANKSDIRSRIIVEAWQAHYEEDHNNRFFKNEDSTFLWEPISDEGIRRKLKCGITDKEKYEQK